MILDTEGGLWMLDPKRAVARRLPRHAGKIVDLCVPANRSRLLALAELGENLFRVDEWTGAHWNEGAQLLLQANPAGLTFPPSPRLACGDGIWVVTSRHLLAVGEAGARDIRLSSRIEPDFARHIVLPYAGALWVGVDAGEWGGAVRRIDPESGEVQTIASEIWPGVCSGPLSAKCDATFALAASPWHKDCVIAAVGSLHMTVKGRLLEICDGQVTRFYFRRLDNDDLWESIKKDPMEGGEPALTVGFYGFARYNDELVALGFADPGRPRFSPLPSPVKIAGFGLAEVLPDIYVVQMQPPDVWPDKGPVHDGSQFLLVGPR